MQCFLFCLSIFNLTKFHFAYLFDFDESDQTRECEMQVNTQIHGISYDEI